jgi:beta-galactosidase
VKKISLETPQIMMKTSVQILILFLLFSCAVGQHSQKSGHVRSNILFDADWKFSLNGDSAAVNPAFDDTSWRTLDLPHDWSIEAAFDEHAAAGVGGGALPGGIGWYRKKFAVSTADKEKKVFIDFDGVYWNSEVWINGHHLGKRPNGYISFRYELTSFVNTDKENVIVVKVDNSSQPNSRWYSGSGIYRHVWLVKTSPMYIVQWGTYITTPSINEKEAKVVIETRFRNATGKVQKLSLLTELYDKSGSKVAEAKTNANVSRDSMQKIVQDVMVLRPELWSVEKPNLYKAVSVLSSSNKIVDSYETVFGIRSFEFDPYKGFSLNGKSMKILGVCNHHDLGCLGTAVNARAIERQLEILRGMGVNAIRTSHNPPAPELLDLCDRMGFIVMDEVFDMWKKKKSDHDYSQYWDEWHEKDLRDFIYRDRNHPAVMIWSIGNEIGEQWDSTGVAITKELAGIVKTLDATRPVTTGNNEVNPHNSLINSGALDLIGYNYHHQDFADFHKRYPGKKFIATETTSALETRGHYDMPSDSIRRWPLSWDKIFVEGNKDNTVSAYDNVSAPWGSTHEETWKVMKKYEHLSGMFIWTGFDYLGEPTPYIWPSRSSYFGVIDLAGFPKDSYYMYKSEWTSDPVLHLFPHWNWKPGQVIDLWAYYNHADEVELFVNGVSKGIKKKSGDDLHVMWRVPFEAGSIKAVSRRNGNEVLTKEIKTAGPPATILLEADRNVIESNGRDLSFVTVKILDSEGNIVPHAESNLKFEVSGEGFIAGVDNGDPTSHESFKADSRKAFHGLALVVIQSKSKPGSITVKATSGGLKEASIQITAK